MRIRTDKSRGISCLALALALGTASTLGGCGGGGGAAEPEPAPVVQGDLRPVRASGDIVDNVKAVLAARRSAPMALGASLGTAAGTNEVASAPSFSTTTRQEDTVDEDDLVKSDGRTLYAIKPPTAASGATLQVDRRRVDGSLTTLQSITLPGHDAGAATTQPMGRGLLWSIPAQRVVALQRDIDLGTGCPAGMACLLRYLPANPTLTLDLMKVQAEGTLGAPTRALIQGDLLSSRLVGNTMVLVTTHRPVLEADALAPGPARDAALAALTARDILPQLRVDGGAAMPLVDETQCYLQVDNGSLNLQITTITTVDLARDGFAATSRCFVGGTEAVYVAPDNVYLATARWPQPTLGADGRWTYPARATLTTDIHKFNVSGGAVTYRATGAVDGHLGWQRDRTPYRFSEHRGDLRVVTFTGSSGWGAPSDARAGVPASPATLTVLREDAGTRRLQTLATLPNARRPAPIGLPGEQVYAVRFVGDRGYVVTFRQIDPLYVLDLADAADPRQAGELKVTGFSESLYPLANGLLLGVGRDADDRGFVRGVKVALFDVADPARPGLLDTRLFGATGSSTALDHSSHGISLHAVGDVTRVGLPMALRSGAGGSSLFDHALQRLEIDTRARTLRVLSPSGLATVSIADGYERLTTDRSLHVDAHVYFFSGGQWQGFAW